MTMAMKNPPRRTTIRGQKHLLAYITPEEADVLKAMGGSGELHNGIPSFPPGFGSERSGYGAERAGGAAGGKSGAAGPSKDSSGPSKDKSGPSKDKSGPDRPDVAQQRQTSAAETAKAAAKAAAKVNPGSGVDAAKAAAAEKAAIEAALAETGPASGGISPGQSQAMFGTPQYAGLGTEQAISAAKLSGNEFAGGVEKARAIDIASLQNLNRQLEDLSRQERVYQNRLNSPLSLIPGVGLANYLGLQNVRNLASASIGQPPGLLGSFGFDERVSPEFGGLGVSGLVGLQSQAITDDMGNLVGFRDEAGNVRYGRDPNAGFDGDGPEVVPTQTNPVTGQEECPEGYVFDEDLQACRMGGDLPMDYTAQPGVGPATGDLYGRMGLLDIAPTGLGMFKQRFGAGFGSPSEFDVANRAFRQSGGVMRPYQGYTLLS